MQVPKRKPGKYTLIKPDPNITEEKFSELKRELEKLKKDLPHAAAETKRLAEMGDFSENAAYQIAKGRLRGINERILELEDLIKHAVIIQSIKNQNTVHIGHTVTTEIDGNQKTYCILGSSEANPDKGVISHNSPLGSALIGRRVGEKIIIPIAKKAIECKIIKIQ